MRRVTWFGPVSGRLSTQWIDDRKYSICDLSRLVYLPPSSALEIDDFVLINDAYDGIQGEQPRWIETRLETRIHVTNMTLRRALIFRALFWL